MVLRRKTTDNSVRYVPITEKTRESKPKTIKAGSLPRNQNKKFSQKKNKISIKTIQHKDSKILNE